MEQEIVMKLTKQEREYLLPTFYRDRFLNRENGFCYVYLLNSDEVLDIKARLTGLYW